MTERASPPPPLPPELAERGERRYRDFHDAAGAAGAEPPALADLPGDALRAFALSDFLARTARGAVATFLDLHASGALASATAEPPARVGAGPRALDHYRALVDAALAEARDEAALMAALRRLRQREMVRIAWRDLTGLAVLEETVRDLSDLADVIVAASAERLQALLESRFGVPESPAGERERLAVFALGKLGARELNFSSDIDLIFAYASPGETRGARRSMSHEEFFTRLGRALIRALDHSTDLGVVFRVDMRLRPFGASGPLAMSFDALEGYYQAHGRDWERYALIRMRPVAGDVDATAEVIERLRPFVYRRYLDFGALESLREMKTMIEHEVARRSLDDDVKLGRGGIREIEFTGQAFQMVRGGRRPELRDRHIVTVIERLGEAAYLPAHAVDELTGAYRFLRDSEHRLQQVDDRQTHRLPADDLGRMRLAAGMGFECWADYERELAKHRSRVSAHFAQVFGTPVDEDAASDPLSVLSSPTLDPEHAEELLEAAGFDRPDAARESIANLCGSRATALLDRRGRARLRRLLPDVVRACAAQPHGARTLDRVVRILEGIARRSAYLALLVERPIALSQLVQLCAASPWIAQLIERHPLLLDELLDARTLYQAPGRESLERDLATRLGAVEPGDTEMEMAALRHFKQAGVLHVAAADVSGRAPLMVVSDHLSQIAETALAAALALAERDLRARYGTPYATLAGERRESPFAIVAYGKLGGLELGYGSDLDLVFVYGGGEDAHTEGAREVDNAVYFGRLAQRVIHFLATTTSDGSLYEVDARLRPGGASGQLVHSIAAFTEYLESDAWTWEHQALVRARPVAGDAGLGRRIASVRRRVLLRPRDPEALREEVRTMRERMRTELGSRGGDMFDLKQDRGGIADIEFLVQYGALRWASRLGEYLEFTDNIRLLEGLARAGLLEAAEIRLLTDAYRAYRTRVHAAALQRAPAVLEADELAGLRDGVAAIWNRVMER